MYSQHTTLLHGAISAMEVLYMDSIHVKKRTEGKRENHVNIG